MRISAMVELARMLGGDWRCPLGDEAAHRFGRSQAVFVRSSATHVFVTDGGPDTARLVLRMLPVGEESVLRRSVTTAAQLIEAGAPVAAPVQSSAGRFVEHVAGFVVVAMQAVEGTILESRQIDDESAHRWGALLAQFHESARAIDPDTDPRRGIVHGDPELDNVVWATDGPVFVDLDDVHNGWYAADLTFALRDWSPPAGPPNLTDPTPSAFLDGYRTGRPFTDDELCWLPGLARQQAEQTLRKLAPVLAEDPDPSWPDWAHPLRERVTSAAATLRDALR